MLHRPRAPLQANADPPIDILQIAGSQRYRDRSFESGQRESKLRSAMSGSTVRLYTQDEIAEIVGHPESVLVSGQSGVVYKGALRRRQGVSDDKL